MKLTYKLEGIGWARVHLELNGKEQFFSPSYLSEPLIDLLDSFMVLFPEFTPKDEIKTSSSLEWDEEPTIIEWKFKKLNDKHLQVTIIQYDDGIKEEDGKNLGKVVLEETCKTQDMLSQLVSSLDTIILKHGFVGYRENWYAGEFPISRYLKLKHQLHYQSSIQIENVGENEYIKSTIEEELKMLNGLL